MESNPSSTTTVLDDFNFWTNLSSSDIINFDEETFSFSGFDDSLLDKIESEPPEQAKRLKFHRRIHTGQKPPSPFECAQCDCTFRDKSNLIRHAKIHKKSHACEVCHLKYPGRAALKEHLKSHARFECRSCDFTTNSRDTLKQHVKSQHTQTSKTFLCTICKYSTKYRIHFEIHSRVHTGERPFECLYCDYKSRDNSTLKRHISTHTGDKPFTCTYCDYKATRRSQLDEHLAHHTGVKPVVCPQCGYTCATKTYLKQHMKNHGGEKRFACGSCNYRVKSQWQLESHMESHAKKQILTCQYCNFKTIMKSVLNSHVQSHTQVVSANDGNLFIVAFSENPVPLKLIDIVQPISS